jgi:hypothetical protein
MIITFHFERVLDLEVPGRGSGAQEADVNSMIGSCFEKFT